MRKNIFGLLILAIALSSCEFNKSVNKDLTTGAFSKGDGISCNRVDIELNGIAENRTNFFNGEKVNLIFHNVSGLKKVNNRVYPGLSMIVVKDGKDTVINHLDLFKDMTNGTDLAPLLLNAHFMSSLPFENNEKYKVYIKIWDKKGKGTFQYELPFTVQENKLLTIREKNISYSDIYLWNETEKLVVVNQEIDKKDTFILILEGLDGIKIIDDKIFPSFSIEIADKNGKKILSTTSILEKYRTTGIDQNTFKEGQLPVTLTFSSGSINNPCKLKAVLSDLNSENKLELSSVLIIK